MPRDPKKPEGFNDYEQKLLHTIDKFGWQVTGVLPRNREEGHAWSYSTGLFYHYQHPELITFNETTDLRASMINAIGERVRQGEKFEPGPSYADIIGGGHYVQVRPVHVSHYADWVNSSIWFYDWDPASFPLLQCFYPDMNGKFPWENGCEQWAIGAQPLLYEPKNVAEQKE
jgi:hypothetical protein